MYVHVGMHAPVCVKRQSLEALISQPFFGFEMIKVMEKVTAKFLLHSLVRWFHAKPSCLNESHAPKVVLSISKQNEPSSQKLEVPFHIRFNSMGVCMCDCGVLQIIFPF
jgi:hypothetical protein